MKYLYAGDADFQHQSFLELRPIAVWTQLLGELSWLASLLLSHPHQQVDAANTVLVCLIMLAGTLLSLNAGHRHTLLLGMLLNLCGLALGFRLNMLFVADTSLWATAIAVCISLTMAPVFQSSYCFVLASCCVWGILLQGTLQDRRLWQQDSLMALLTMVTLASGLMLNILFRRLRLRGYYLRRDLEALAFQDALTGIDNRRSLLEKLQAWYPAQHGHFLMVDIDDFKSVNDDFGHEAGDQVLQQVARQLSGHPDVALCGRLGGEEFGLFTRLLDSQRVCELASQLIHRVNSCSVEQRRLSISIGIVLMDGRIGLSAALRQADAALYQAKHRGKNGFVLALSCGHPAQPQTLAQAG